MENYKICKRCVMDTSDPDITFNNDGFCNHCETFIKESKTIKPQGKEREERLNLLIENIKKSGKSKKYDCLIGLSGGTDSSYVAYIVNELGLRPLAVHMDNGWNSEESVKNIRNLCTKLSIDYESYVLDWNKKLKADNFVVHTKGSTEWNVVNRLHYERLVEANEISKAFILMGVRLL